MDGYRRTMLPGKNVEINFFFENAQIKTTKNHGKWQLEAQLSPAKSITRKSIRNTLH